MFSLSVGLMATAQTVAPLKLEKAIPLPNVQGRIDHLAIDLDTPRLFVAALGNNSIEVIDIKEARHIRTIPGFAEPQGVLYISGKNRLFVANGGDGTVRIFDATTYKLLRSVAFGDDADNLRLDPSTNRIYVGYGNGALGILDSEGNRLADIKMDAHPESFRLENTGTRIFVNLPDSRKIAVLDRIKSSVVANWSTGVAQANFPMALDESDGRVFVVCRKPAVLLVLDIETGGIVAQLPVAGDSDDVFYDQKRKRIYASGGTGAITIFQQNDADHYSRLAELATKPGARTSLFVPELDSLFLAVRRQGQDPAEIRIYRTQP